MEKGRQAYEIQITHPQIPVTQQAKANSSRLINNTNMFTH